MKIFKFYHRKERREILFYSLLFGLGFIILYSDWHLWIIQLLFFWAAALISSSALIICIKNSKRKLDTIHFERDKIKIVFFNRKANPLQLKRNEVKILIEGNNLKLLYRNNFDLIGYVTKDSMEKAEEWEELIAEFNPL